MGYCGDYVIAERLCYLYDQRICDVGDHKDCLIIDVREIQIDNPEDVVCAYYYAGVNRTFYFANEHECKTWLQPYDPHTRTGTRWITVRWVNHNGHKVIRGVWKEW